MPKVTIDGQEIEVAPGTTILQACQQAGIEIPHFCYHERLNIAGNCPDVPRRGRALAEAGRVLCDAGGGRQRDPDAIGKGAEKRATASWRMLLINHPLDCPICDQGGECDLQDQAMAYGFDRGRFEENKRAVRDKEFRPAGQDQHEPLHPLHPLHPLYDRDRRSRRTRRHRARRGDGDHDLYRARARLGTVG
jgi:NADH-quinone oxidoreductase subunit G